MNNNAEITLLYVPCGSEDEAANIAAELLADKLIACANIYRSRSLYNWEAKLADEIEYVIFAKTTGALVPRAEERIRQLHSYDIPCVLSLRPDGVSQPYAMWVAGEVATQVNAATSQIGEM